MEIPTAGTVESSGLGLGAEISRFQLMTISTTIKMAKRKKTRLWSSGKGRRRLMDQAKVEEKQIGPTPFANDAIISARPLRVPRWEASTALLTAKVEVMNAY